MKYKTGKNITYLRVLGKTFVENNRNKGFLIINNKKISMKEVVQIKKNKIYMMINKNIYNRSCMFKNCGLLESFSKILYNDEIENLINMENNTDSESCNLKKRNKSKKNNSTDYWGAGAEIEDHPTISEISLKDDESLDNSKGLYILYFNNKLKYTSFNYALLKEMFSN